MADFTFNVALGRTRTYADLAGGANDALIVVLLKSAGLEVDGTLRDHDDLAALLAAANDECDFTGYSRKTLASVVNTAVDDTNNRADSDAADPSAYTNSGASQLAGKLLVCYDPDTTAGTDSSIVPLTAHDCVVTFDTGVPASVAFAAAGFYRAQG